jgi:hypothetical protein
MAKQLSMLLVIAALLVVGLVGFLFFSPCGVTIEKFQDVPAEKAKPAFVPPVVEDSVPPPPMPVKGLKNPTPAPSQPLAVPQALLPQAGVPAIKSMTPPQPIAAPTKVPIAPTPASSPAALTLTQAQCSALCPVTQESCEGKFSCQTRLEPIGVTPMSRTSTPAQIDTTV